MTTKSLNNEICCKSYKQLTGIKYLSYKLPRLYEPIKTSKAFANWSVINISVGSKESKEFGFARRWAYKRGDLILRDAQRALKIFADRDHPVQIIFAGKAHPADEEGQRIIQRLMEWCRHSAIQHRVALIEDYDIYTGQKLVQGVNVWLNNPRRPLEASGTSGQKVCFNGGINCSVLDGWWCEGYQVGADGKGINGWAIGEDAHTSDRELQDRIDSQSLYQLLESENIPLYYEQDANGIPHGWIQKMKASIRTNAPLFNTDRMIADYVTQVYALGCSTMTTPSLARAIA